MNCNSVHYTKKHIALCRGNLSLHRNVHTFKVKGHIKLPSPCHIHIQYFVYIPGVEILLILYTMSQRASIYNIYLHKWSIKNIRITQTPSSSCLHDNSYYFKMTGENEGLLNITF